MSSRPFDSLAITTPAMSRARWGLKRTVDAVNEPVTLAEAKDHMRISDTNDDTYIPLLIKAARRRLEEETGRAFCTQTWRFVMDQFPRYTRRSYPVGFMPIILPRPPLIVAAAIQSPATPSSPNIAYLDGAGNPQTLVLNTDFIADGVSEPARLQLAFGKSWPATIRQQSAVTIDFQAGYSADATLVPEELKMAIKMVIAHWYENRESVIVEARTTPQEVPQSAMWLIDPFKVNWEFDCGQDFFATW